LLQFAELPLALKRELVFLLWIKPPQTVPPTVLISQDTMRLSDRKCCRSSFWRSWLFTLRSGGLGWAASAASGMRLLPAPVILSPFAQGSREHGIF
jgi:hypothetical protein